MRGLGRIATAGANWVVVVGVVAAFVWGANRGLDPADESYHLLSYRLVDVVPKGVTQFALIINAMTFHTELSVAGYRVLQIMLLIPAALVFMLAFETFARGRLPELAARLPSRVTLLGFGALAGMLGLSWLPRTVSYLSLTPVIAELVAALLLFATARPTHAHPFPPRVELAAAAVAGSALALLVYVKFTTAVLMWALSGVFLLVVRGWRQGLVLGAILSVGTAATGFLLAGDLSGVGPFSLQGVREGASAAADGSHAVGFLLRQYLGDLRATSFVSVRSLLLALTFSAPLLATYAAPRYQRPAAWALAVPGPVALVLVLRSEQMRDVFRAQRITYMVLGGICFGLAICSVVHVVERRRSGGANGWGSSTPGRRWCAVGLTGLLVAMPFAGAIGTNTQLALMTLNTGPPIAALIALAWAARNGVLSETDRHTAVAYVALVFTTIIFGFQIVNGVTLHTTGTNLSALQQTEAVAGLPGLQDLRLDPKSARVLAGFQRRLDEVARPEPGDLILVGESLEILALAAGGRIPGNQFLSNDQQSCLLLERVPEELAQTDVVVRSTFGGGVLDVCVDQLVPGYPEDFERAATVDGFGDDEIEIWVRATALSAPRPG